MRIVAGKFRGRLLKAPKGDQTRPTSSRLRGAIFNMLQNEIEGALFLDLFAGSGAIGIEALSRGASQAVFVESSPDALSAIRQNLDALDLSENALLIRNDYKKALQTLQERKFTFDIVFADAPYALKDASSCLLDLLASCSLLKPNARILIEETSPSPQEHPSFKLLSSRKAGKTNLHDYRALNLTKTA